MSEKKHFEDLWLQAENLFKDDPSTTPEILLEIKSKLSVYQSLDKMDQMSKDDKKKAKAAIFGTLLMSICQLTLVDDINSFAVLQNAIQSLQKEKSL